VPRAWLMWILYSCRRHLILCTACCRGGVSAQGWTKRQSSHLPPKDPFAVLAPLRCILARLFNPNGTSKGFTLADRLAPCLWGKTRFFGCICLMLDLDQKLICDVPHRLKPIHRALDRIGPPLVFSCPNLTKH
jgi:hypothetical protein